MVPASRPRLLIASAEPEVGRRLAEIVSEIGDIEVLPVAYDGAGALRRFRATPPDVVLLDIAIDRNGGVPLLRTMRDERGDCLLWMLTAQGEPSYVERCLEAGADRVLDLMADVEALVELLRGLMAPSSAPPP